MTSLETLSENIRNGRDQMAAELLLVGWKTKQGLWYRPIFLTIGGERVAVQTPFSIDGPFSLNNAYRKAFNKPALIPDAYDDSRNKMLVKKR